MGVEPEHAPGPVRASQSAERPERHGVVAAEDERQLVGFDGGRDSVGHTLTGGQDRSQVAKPGVALVDRLGHCGLDVAPVKVGEPESLQPGLEPRVADRRRAHVHAPAAGAEIERSADDGDRARVRSHRHAGQPTSAACWRARQRARPGHRREQVLRA